MSNFVNVLFTSLLFGQLRVYRQCKYTNENLSAATMPKLVDWPRSKSCNGYFFHPHNLLLVSLKRETPVPELIYCLIMRLTKQ